MKTVLPKASMAAVPGSQVKGQSQVPAQGHFWEQQAEDTPSGKVSLQVLESMMVPCSLLTDLLP